jgi:hypothetical protein
MPPTRLEAVSRNVERPDGVNIVEEGHLGVETRGRVRSRERLTFAHVLRLGAYLMTLLSIVVFFAVSPLVLAKIGINYETAGGSPLEKIHPGTFLAMFALCLRLASSAHPFKLLWHLMTHRIGLFLFIGTYLVATVYTLLFLKVPFTPMVDTFLMPIIFALLLQDLDERAARLLACVLGLLLCANAFIALAEYLLNWRLVSFQLPEGVTGDPAHTELIFDWRATLELEWRATALLGHPLQNGLIVSSFILILASPGAGWIPNIVRMPLLLLELTSMVTFGSRVSLTLTLLFGGLLILRRIAVFLMRRERLGRNLTIFAILCLPIFAGLCAYLAEKGFFDPLIERFGSDAGSAATRVTMFEMFRPIHIYELLFGPDQALVATWQRIEGLEFGIESFWVGMPLIYGVVISAVLICGTACFCHAIIKMSGRGTALILLVFFLTASTSASLSGKTPALGMVTIMILLFLRKDKYERLSELRASDPAALRVKEFGKLFHAIS